LKDFAGAYQDFTYLIEQGTLVGLDETYYSRGLTLKSLEKKQEAEKILKKRYDEILSIMKLYYNEDISKKREKSIAMLSKTIPTLFKSPNPL
jgi:hypothetical protein